MRSLLPILVTVLFVAPIPVSTAAVSTDYSGQNLIVNSGNLTVMLSTYPEIAFYSSPEEKFFLNYEEILGYNEGDGGFGSAWRIRASLGDAVWERKIIETGKSPTMGNYTKMALSATLDGVQIPSVPQMGVGSQQPISQPILRDWCSVSFTITVADRTYTVNTDRGRYSVIGGNEAKIDISIEVLKDAGVDTLTLKQSLRSTETQNYVLQDLDGMKRIAPGAGIPSGSIEYFRNTPEIEQKMMFMGNDEEKAHYFWESYATVNGESMEVSAHYAQEDGALVIYTSYPAAAGISVYHDPVIGVPGGAGPIKEVTDFVYENMLSLLLGAVTGAAAISVFAYSKSRKERSRDEDILNLEESEYFRK